MRIGTGNLVEVTPRPLPMPRKSFEFPSHPLHKIPVEVPPQLTQCRRVEATIAGLPTTEFRIEHLRQIQQRLLVLELDMPATHASIDLLLRGDTDRRKKVRVNLPFLVHTPSRTESVTKEIKADSRMLFQAIHILAIDDLPGVPFCRYADDGLLHCKSQSQASLARSAKLGNRSESMLPERSRSDRSGSSSKMTMTIGTSALPLSRAVLPGLPGTTIP